ncbi:MAG TPA: hypothetical protein VE978_19275 [Chitinophagales bacterium]|nr:hypothetical protein [Chitinophagales bacterium]
MKLKFILVAASVIFLFGIYGWRCSSSKKAHGGKQQRETAQASTASGNPGIVNLSAAAATSSSSNESSASGAISISTAHAVPLYKQIHSACTADIFFSKGRQTRDILADPYFSFVKSFNFTSLQYSGGSTADHDHAIVGDTRISGGKGDGYNIRAEDCKVRGEDINSVVDGVGSVHFGVDFFNEYCALLNKLGIPGDLIANVQAGTLDELYWKIEQSHAERVIFGMEQNLPSNEFDFPDGKAYKAKITRWMQSVKEKYPNIIIGIDAAPIYRRLPKFTDWNDQVRDMPGDEVRLYLWDKDAVDWQQDQNQNLATMDQSFSTTFPGWLDKLKQQFPGKKASIWQWGLKPPKTPLYNTMAACIYIGKFYKFMIDYNKANNNYISYASFMSLKSLNRGDGGILNHAYALQVCGKLFTGNKRVLDLSINGINGVVGVACDDPGVSGGKYTLLLINETGNEVSLPNITVNNSPVRGKKITVTSVNASSLGSVSVSMDTQTYSSLSLHPYSVNVVEF